MRLLFLGMPGPFSYLVLEGLIARGFKASAVLLTGSESDVLRPLYVPEAGRETHPAGEADLHIVNPSVGIGVRVDGGGAAEGGHPLAGTGTFAASYGGPLRLATREGIPAYASGDIGHREVRRWLGEMAVDVVCVACWDRIIPASALAIPRYGFLNVHPSLLPFYRGPYPLFWQFREGERATGVTVHWMDGGLDTGDIAGQRELLFEDGMRGAEAEALCATAGASLAADVLEALGRGQQVRERQTEGGSYFGRPSAADFSVDAGWHVRRAFNFMRGTAEWRIPFRYEGDATVRWFRDALAWREGAPGESAGGGAVWAAFRGGSVLALEGQEGRTTVVSG